MWELNRAWRERTVKWTETPLQSNYYTTTTVYDARISLLIISETLLKVTLSKSYLKYFVFLVKTQEMITYCNLKGITFLTNFHLFQCSRCFYVVRQLLFKGKIWLNQSPLKQSSSRWTMIAYKHILKVF